MHGGVSNRTVKVDFNGTSWVLKQALTKLRVKGDWFSSPERIYYEAEGMKWFHQNLPGVCPRLVFEDRDKFILAMETVIPPFDNLKELLMTSGPRISLFEKAGYLLGQIHHKGQNRETIPGLFYNRQFFESLRIEPYYNECIRQVSKSSDFLNQLIIETRSNGYTVTHGDYSPKNLLVKNDQLILLDHEVIHFGDGTFDLGFFTAHLLSKANLYSSYRSDFLKGILSFFRYYQTGYAKLNQQSECRAIKHSVACLLARVSGLSPVEYLNYTQRQIQKSVALGLIDSLPDSVDELVAEFGRRLAEEESKFN